ncbi:hypothetical protein ACA910_019087 [Epithemia clementina (nom. ined.)]
MAALLPAFFIHDKFVSSSSGLPIISADDDDDDVNHQKYSSIGGLPEKEEEHLPFYLSCVHSLIQADTNRDLRLHMQEFVQFLHLAVGIDTPFFGELPLDYVATFHSGACVQCFQLTGKEDCCLGNRAFIDISQALLVASKVDKQREGGTSETRNDHTIDVICSSVHRYGLKYRAQDEQFRNEVYINPMDTV